MGEYVAVFSEILKWDIKSIPTKYRHRKQMLTINRFSSNSILRIRILEACDLTDGTHCPNKIVRAFFTGFAIENLNFRLFRSYRNSLWWKALKPLKIFWHWRHLMFLNGVRAVRAYLRDISSPASPLYCLYFTVVPEGLYVILDFDRNYWRFRSKWKKVNWPWKYLWYFDVHYSWWLFLHKK